MLPLISLLTLIKNCFTLPHKNIIPSRALLIKKPTDLHVIVCLFWMDCKLRQNIVPIEVKPGQA